MAITTTTFIETHFQPGQGENFHIKKISMSMSDEMGNKSIQFSLECIDEARALLVGQRMNDYMNLTGIEGSRSMDIELSLKKSANVISSETLSIHKFDDCVYFFEILKEMQFISEKTLTDLEKYFNGHLTPSIEVKASVDHEIQHIEQELVKLPPDLQIEYLEILTRGLEQLKRAKLNFEKVSLDPPPANNQVNLPVGGD